MALLISCKDISNQNNNLDKIKSEDYIDDTLSKNNEKIISNNLKDSLVLRFSEVIKNFSLSGLPYKLNEKLYKECCFGISEEKLIKKITENEDWKLFYECENYILYPDSLRFNNTNKRVENYIDNLKNIDKNFSLKSCKILKGFKSSENKNKLFLASSKIRDLDFLFFFTYSDLRVIDYYIIGILMGFDEYNEYALYISRNLEITSFNFSYYEGLPYVENSKFIVLDNGKISKVDSHSFEIDIEKNFHDYKNDYKEFNIEPILKEEKTRLFKDFVSKIPTLNLPYNSKEFYSYMDIASPEEGKPNNTLLDHNKLTKYKNVKYFFSNNANDIAFKKEGNDYKEGYYYYPIGKINISSENTAVLYLYQSFCNYHPTIYVQLNTYDNLGNIVDAQILDRRFFSGVYRFLSSIQIEQDLKINIKSYIQNYEGYGEDDFKQEAPEIKETSFQINVKGIIE